MFFRGIMIFSIKVITLVTGTPQTKLYDFYYSSTDSFKCKLLSPLFIDPQLYQKVLFIVDVFFCYATGLTVEPTVMTNSSTFIVPKRLGCLRRKFLVPKVGILFHVSLSRVQVFNRWTNFDDLNKYWSTTMSRKHLKALGRPCATPYGLKVDPFSPNIGSRTYTRGNWNWYQNDDFRFNRDKYGTINRANDKKAPRCSSFLFAPFGFATFAFGLLTSILLKCSLCHILIKTKKTRTKEAPQNVTSQNS